MGRSVETPEWKDAATHREPTWPLAGYAPGGYLGKCVRCEQSFFNLDKRAIHCLPCAIDAIKESETAARSRIRELEAENNTLRSCIAVVSPAPVTQKDKA